MKSITYVLAIGGLLLIILLGLLTITGSDFSPSNPFWNGMSALSFATNALPVYDLASAGPMGPGDTLLVISPSLNFSPEDVAGVRAFLRGGGRVVVMDDFGNADSLLNGLGSPVTIDTTPLYEYEYYYKNQSCPIVQVSNLSGYSKYASSLVLNHPAALTVNGSALIAASTTKFAWLDKNGNTIANKNEAMNVYPVMASCGIGAGELLVISDPDLFINSMLDMGDNKGLLAGIARGHTWLDASHGMEISPVMRVYYSLKFDSRLRILAVLMILTINGLALLYRPVMGLVAGQRLK